MESHDRQVIDGLFDRLKQAEDQGGTRDDEAAEHIAAQVKTQPHAPYYMAQAMIVQEAALKKLNAKVSDLEQRLADAERLGAAPQKSGFLSSLFGGGGRPSEPAPTRTSAPPPSYGPQPGAAAPRGSGFLGGALQTAAGVAGGIVVADMLTSMFHHTQPEEMVEIINEPSNQPMDTGFGSGDPYNNGDADWGNTNWNPNADPSYDDTGYDPGNDDTGSWDDDSSGFM